MTGRRDRDRRDSQLMGLYVGRVTRRDDPDGLGRVRVEVPGLLEPESGWAWPLGSPGGGNAQRGTFEPPALESTVGVLFNQGEVDEPYYLTGPWGEPEGASDIPQGGAVGTTDEDRADRQVAVQEDGEWRLTRDSRTEAGGKRWLLEHKATGLSVYLDGDAEEIHLVSPTSDQAMVRGTEYRTAETSYLAGLHAAIASLGSDLVTVTNIGDVATAGTALGATLALIPDQDVKDDATAYLSEKAWTE